MKLKYLKINDASKLSKRELEDCLHILNVDSTNYYMLTTWELENIAKDKALIQSLLTKFNKNN